MKKIAVRGCKQSEGERVMKGKRGVGLVIFAVLVTVCVCGCRSVSVSDYTAYQKEDFTQSKNVG